MARRAGSRALTPLAVLLAAAVACTPGPRPLALGSEQCAHCHMTLADPRFAGELVTRTGRVIPFDDVGCLATFVATGGIAPDEIHSLWVNDFARPDSLLRVADAVFLESDSLHTPMDYGLAALRPGAPADSVRARLGGELVSWDAVMLGVRNRPAH